MGVKGSVEESPESLMTFVAKSKTTNKIVWPIVILDGVCEMF